ncbi:hypothetical protein WJX84_010481 [Apatococcus fuscideae]|uniref:Uncharacterized protein n=1 Tax=Apatococcus fuscideae TaxID=2026836 RepID=A0AAW1TCI1_9CHLO
MVLGGVHDYRAAGKLLDELKSSATDLQPPPKLPAADELRPQQKRRRALTDENAPSPQPKGPAKLPRVARLTADQLRRERAVPAHFEPGSTTPLLNGPGDCGIDNIADPEIKIPLRCFYPAGNAAQREPLRPLEGNQAPPQARSGPTIWELHWTGGDDGITPTDLSLAQPLAPLPALPRSNSLNPMRNGGRAVEEATCGDDASSTSIERPWTIHSPSGTGG